MRAFLAILLIAPLMALAFAVLFAGMWEVRKNVPEEKYTFGKSP